MNVQIWLFITAHHCVYLCTVCVLILSIHTVLNTALKVFFPTFILWKSCCCSFSLIVSLYLLYLRQCSFWFCISGSCMCLPLWPCVSVCVSAASSSFSSSLGVSPWHLSLFCQSWSTSHQTQWTWRSQWVWGHSTVTWKS